MHNPQENLRQGIIRHFRWQLLSIGFFMPEEILTVLENPLVTNTELLSLLLKTHETALAMFLTTDNRTQLIRTHFTEIIIKIKTVQATLEDPKQNLNLAIDTLLQQLPSTWKGVENGIHEETKQHADVLQKIVDHKLLDYFYEKPASKDIVTQTIAGDYLHEQYHKFLDPKYIPVGEIKILHFLTHYIKPSDIVFCLQKKHVLFNFYQTHIRAFLSAKLGDQYELAYHTMKLLALLNSWLIQIRDLQTADHRTLSRTKMQFLSDFMRDLDKKDLFFLLKFNELFRKHNDMTAAEFLRKLQLQCQSVRSRIQQAETKLQPATWAGRAQFIGTEIFHSCYHVEIAQLIYDATQECYQLLTLPDLSLHINHTLLSVLKKLSVPLLATMLLMLDSGTHYITLLGITRLLFSQFNLLCSLAQKFSGDEITVLTYTSIAERITRYLLFMSFIVASSMLASADFNFFDDYNFNELLQNIYQHAVAVLPTAHLAYGFNELFQYLYTHYATPLFSTLHQHHPRYHHIINALYTGTLLSGITLNQHGLNHLLAFLQPPVCDTHQALRDLGLNSDATSTDIRHAWKRASMLHPDKSTHDDTAFVQASSAYNCLTQTGLHRRAKFSKSPMD